MWRKGNPHTLLMGMKMGAVTMGKSMGYLKKLKIELLYDPAIPVLYQKKQKPLTQKDTFNPTFLVALFISAKI